MCVLPDGHGIDESGTTQMERTLVIELDAKRSSASPEFTRAFFLLQHCIAKGEDFQTVESQVQVALNILSTLHLSSPTANNDLYFSKVLALCGLLTLAFNNTGEGT
ncbi:unnamed protein product [Rhizoctonia solani]|uniref:Uncharacterized protein n=1 Tax=Rhizoctonia solani TaxID=456999 RepID=A0A8H2XT76_9AGAM|nr:unnamed protein product [Rhizoctonia solani]